MSVEMVTALTTGIVTILTAVGTLIVSLRNGKLIQKDSVIKDHKLDEIHTLVNSRLTRALDEIKELRTYITSQKFSNSTLKEPS